MGDFGYGWNLAIAQTDIRWIIGGRETENPGSRPIESGDRLVVTLPNGEEESFVFTPQQQQSNPFVPSQYYNTVWTPTNGTSSELLYDQPTLYPFGSGYVVWPDFNNDYSASDLSGGSSFGLQLRNGTVLEINEQSGELESITDTTGNTIYFTENGFESSRGRGIDIQRDWRGRVSSVTGPDGNSVTYQYDGRGDLVSVTDQIGATTQFRYADDRPHFLDEIIDPLGRPAARTTYDSDGRIESMIDADGNSVTYAYNTDTKVQFVTDQLGFTTEIELDDDGNAVREVSPEGVITLRSFDANGNATSETLVIGQPDSTANGETDDLTSTFTFDADSNLTSQTDLRGNTSTTLYSSDGTPTVITDVLGNVTRRSVDPNGFVDQIVTPDGQQRDFAYDLSGEVTAFTLNGQKRFDSVVNRFGDVVRTTAPNGLTRNYEFDDTGLQFASWSINDAGDGPVQQIEFSRFDSLGRSTEALQVELPEGEFISQFTSDMVFEEQFILSRNRSVYDLTGQLIETTNELGLVSQYTYDARGFQIEVRQQSVDLDGQVVWGHSRTAYDARGNAVAQTGEVIEGRQEDVEGVQTIYNGDGQIASRQVVADLDIDLLFDSGSASAIGSVVVNVGDVLTETSTIYDDSGRVLQTVGVNGLISELTYGSFGEVSQSRVQAPDRDGNLVWLVSHTVRDQYGRTILSTTPTIEGSGDLVYATATLYDLLGRVEFTENLEGVVVEVIDGDAVIMDAGRVLSQRQTEYDDRGRISFSVSGDGQRVDYEHDSFGRQTATIEPARVVDGVVVRHRVELEYNQLGEVEVERSGIRQLPDGTIDRSDAQEVRYEYDVRGNLTRTTLPDGTFVTTEYDELDRVTTETDAVGNSRHFQYDGFDQLASVTLPSFNDASGELITPVYRYGYDAEGNQVSLTDPLDRVSEWQYNARGQQIARTLPNPLVDSAEGASELTERFQYDARGRQTVHISFEGVVSETIYDDYSRVSQIRFFDTVADYDDGMGNPQEIWTYSFDAYGREVEVVQTDMRAGQPESRSSQTVYDDQGRPISLINDEGQLHYIYDDLGRRVMSIVGDPDAPQRQTRFGYDSIGRLESVTEVDLSGASDPVAADAVSRTFYDLRGNLDAELNANGVLTDYVYDDVDRLRAVTAYRTDGSDSDIADLSDNVAVSDFRYEVRPDGRRVRLDEMLLVPDGSGGEIEQTSTRTYEYDQLGRLITETTDADFDDTLDAIIHYDFDATGNRVKKSVDSDPVDTNSDGEITTADTPDFDVFTDYTYNLTDQLLEEVISNVAGDVTGQTTYQYDGTHQVGATEVDQAGIVVRQTTSSYDLQGRLAVTRIEQFEDGQLSSSSQSEYRYDATGIRVGALRQIDSDGDGVFESVSDVHFLIDHINETGHQQVLREDRRDGDGNLVERRDYTFGRDELHQTVIEFDAATGAKISRRRDFFAHDGHGDVRALLDAAGAVVTIAAVEQIFYYDAYGQLLNMDADEAATTLLYSGEQTDALTGQQYLRDRYYDTASGRFNRLDPFSGNAFDPQSFHKYAYVHGDPISGVDPTGQFFGAGLGIGRPINLDCHWRKCAWK